MRSLDTENDVPCNQKYSSHLFLLVRSSAQRDKIESNRIRYLDDLLHDLSRILSSSNRSDTSIRERKRIYLEEADFDRTVIDR